MYDRFLVQLSDGSTCYTTDFTFLFNDIVLDVIKHERTFDDGVTWKEVIL